MYQPALLLLLALGIFTATDWTFEPGRVSIDFDGKFFMLYIVLLEIADSVGRKVYR